MTDCRCGHPQDTHPDEHAGMCVVVHCECLGYRLRPTGPVRPSSQPTLRDLLAAGRRSKRAKAQTLAERIEKSIGALVAELRAEREQEAAASAPTAPSNRSGLGKKRARDKTCPDCGKSGLANAGVHRRLAHGVRKDEGTAA